MADSQKVVKPHLTDLAAAYFGGLAHNHTVLSNHPGHHESDLTMDRFVGALVEAGLAGALDSPIRYLMFNEHPSDPAKPRRLMPWSLQRRRLLRQRQRPRVDGVPIWHGLEVSLLPGGRTDLTPRLTDNCALVIASRHALPAKIERDPEAVLGMFKAACSDPAVGVLGHPQRYIEDINLDWGQILSWAKATGTAIEINANLSPNPDSHLTQRLFWNKWLPEVAMSGVAVVIGVDIHNHFQLQDFIHQWRLLSTPAGRDTHLGRFLRELDAAKIKPKQVVSSSYDGFKEWLGMDKFTRAKLDYVQ